METVEFFNRNFGRHLVDQTSDAIADATKALSTSHPMQTYKPGKREQPQRIAAGWAIIREGAATMQFKLAAQGIAYSQATRYEAWLDVLENWKDEPVMLIEFDKKPVPIGNLFRTFDRRAVHICGPKSVVIFDWTKKPEPNAPMHHKALWNLREKLSKKAA
jgi:hypothetical protein